MDRGQEQSVMTEDASYIVNMRLFKLLGLYPEWETRWAISRVQSFLVAVITAIGIYGWFSKLGTENDPFESLMVWLFCGNGVLSVLKLWVIIANPQSLRQLMDASRVDFLHVRSHGGDDDEVMADCRFASIRFTNVYFWAYIVNLAMYGLSPFLAVRHGSDGRRVNLGGFDYPFVSTDAYNAHFVAFYAFEVTTASFIIYGVFMFDVFFVSFCLALSAQYDAVAVAAHDNADEEIDEKKDYNKLKSLIKEHQRIYEKLKLFYKIFHHVFLIQVAVSTLSVVIICNIILMKESVNTCLCELDWTRTNLRTKKLLLLALRMNNANRLKIKATPKKIIDRKLFLHVMHTSYTLVSIMFKMKTKQNE